MFEAWCESPLNAVMLTGYSVEGTLAKTLQTEPSHVERYVEEAKRGCLFIMSIQKKT